MNKIDAVWELKQKGLKHKDIAQALNLAPATVNTYLTQANQMRNRVQPLPKPVGPISTSVDKPTSGFLATNPSIVAQQPSPMLQEQKGVQTLIEPLEITEEDCQDFYGAIFANEGLISEIANNKSVGVSELRCRHQGSRLYKIFKRHGFTWEYFEELVFGFGIAQDSAHMVKQLMAIRKEAKDREEREKIIKGEKLPEGPPNIHPVFEKPGKPETETDLGEQFIGRINSAKPSGK